MSDLGPIRPGGMPQPNAGTTGADGLRNHYNDRRGGGGRKDREKDKEKESDEDGASGSESIRVEEGRLEGDQFASRRRGPRVEALFAEKLPWETESTAEELIELASEVAKDESTADPLVARGPTEEQRIAEEGQKVRQALPARGTGMLNPRVAIPPRVTPRGTGRLTPPAPGSWGVESAFDSAPAVNQTLEAHRFMQAQQEARERLAEEMAEGPPAPSRVGTGDLPPLARALRGTGAIIPPRPAIPWAPAPPELDPGAFTPKVPPESRSPSGQLKLPARPDIGRVAIPPRPARSPSGPLAPRSEWPKFAAEHGPTAPQVNPSARHAAFVYRVEDAATGLPLAGARLELEPVKDDMLPNLHGQADAGGWYGAGAIPPGEYRVTVRHPGYVPSFKVRVLEAGLTDDMAIFLSKP